MTRQIINIGAAPNDGTGTPGRGAFDAINQNFAELYAATALWDRWQEANFGNSGASSNPMWSGLAIASGTNTSGPPAAALTGIARYGLRLMSSASANSGYRYQTVSLATDWFGQIDHKFRCQYQPVTAFTNRLVRLGYLDTSDQNDAVDGAYFELSGSTCSAKTASNSVRTAAATTLALTLNTLYTFDIEANAAGTSVRFRVWAGTNTNPVFDETITSNIPTSSGRAFGSGIVATSNNLAAEDIGVLYTLGEGTVSGFLRRCGGW